MAGMAAGKYPPNRVNSDRLSASPRGEINSLVRELDHSSKELYSMLENLRGTLSPILQNSTDVSGRAVGEVRKSPSSELGGELDASVHMLRMAITLVGQIHSDLRL